MECMYLKYFTDCKDFPFYIQYGKHDESMFMHYHNDFSELVLVLNGTAIHMVDNEEYFVKKGDVFVISNNTTHGYKDLKNFRICNIMFSFDYMFSLNYDIIKTSGFHSLFIIEPYLTREQHFKSRLQLSISDFETVEKLIDCMVTEYSKKGNSYMTLLHANFMELAVFLTRKYEHSEITEIDNRINIANSVAYMESNFTKPIAIEELAKLANISSRHFSRIFNQTYHTTPINYITALKMQHASTLLINTTKSITEIAYSCGYNDSNYFTRQFKKFFSLTPMQYRNMKQIAANNLTLSQRFY